MDQFQDHERFEMRVLDILNSARLLQDLIFGGGTMLRLCHDLDRYSVDLDFYIKPPFEEGKPAELLSQMVSVLGKQFRITDQADKFNTLLVEVVAQRFPRRLKVEINKKRTIKNFNESIAWSRFSNTQVLMNTVDLSEMAAMKSEALLNRKEIRDAYDLEFLLRQGITIPGDKLDFQRMLAVLRQFSSQDYKVKLGSILNADKRRYYEVQHFRLLEQYLTQQLGE